LGCSIEPNLTDEYSLLSGGVKNLFKISVSGARDDKGMIYCKTTLKP
tara:strand:- start:34 stop:174 length:141 start_codon:yes stop_codon:yes gene_type:complete